jgi:Arm DNA-binding domain
VNKMALSDTRIRSLKAEDKPYKIADERGLFLLVTPAGGKLWRLKYRIDNKEKLLTFGAYPDVSLADARYARDEARKTIAAGEDPNELRKAVKSGKYADSLNSFEVIAREWWQTHMKNKADSHKNKVIRRFELYLFPWLGKKPISSITPPEILEVLKRVEKLNKLETAHRALQTAGQVFRYAVQTGRAIRDVTADLKGALPPTTVKHMAAFTEPKDVAELMRAIDSFNGTFTVHCALRLSPLVFVRPSELRMAKWVDIDFVMV